jgi:pimeloyl-ACP methyl ester carboxylesterase
VCELRQLLIAAISLLLTTSPVATAADIDAAVPATPLSLTPCSIEGVSGPVRCGTLQVAENPKQENGRRVGVNIVVIPALRDTSRRDPIVLLMGGPGEEATSAGPWFLELFASVRRERDILLVDQRGAGLSDGLHCDMYSPEEIAANLRDVFPRVAVERCARQLRGRADLAQYSYSHFATDLEQVRRTLGYDRLNLFAASYGTRAAQVYLKEHARSVRTVFMGSVVPMDVPTPPPLAAAFQAALEKTFAACAADSACHAAYPNLPEEFQKVLARLDAGVHVPLPGNDSEAQLTRGRFVEWLRAKTYQSRSATQVPWIIHRAYVADWKPIVEGIVSDARKRIASNTEFSFGLFFSITCNEDVPFIRKQDETSGSRQTFLGDYRVRQQQAACEYWPRASLPSAYRELVQSSAPTLFVSGDSDPASPLWYTERVARGFSNRVEVLLQEKGHTEWTDCVADLYEQLVQSASVRNLDASCEHVPRAPFKLN